MNNPTDIERVLQSPDQDAIGGEATYCIGCGSCAYLDPPSTSYVMRTVVTKQRSRMHPLSGRALPKAVLSPLPSMRTSSATSYSLIRTAFTMTLIWDIGCRHTLAMSLPMDGAHEEAREAW